jgi:hypothetical protein
VGLENDNLALVRGRVAAHPALASVFEGCVRFLSGAGHAFGVRGSIASGTFDAYSDLDLVIGVARGKRVEDALEQLGRQLVSLGEPLGVFAADHLGKANLLVVYLKSGSGIVKIDVEAHATAPIALDAPFLTLCDPAGYFASLTPTAPTVDPALASLKFCCWLWFIHGKVERGEFFHAARSIDFSREHALLPCIRQRLCLPQDGHRRIEELLPQGLLKALTETYPERLTRAVLRRALDALSALFESEILPLVVSPVDREAEARRFAMVRATIDFDRQNPRRGAPEPNEDR